MASIVPLLRQIPQVVGSKKEKSAMVLRHPNKRSSPRTMIVCPISVTFQSGVAHGIVRDISTGGIFFYLNSKPQLHSEVSFSVRIKGENISGTGEVIRIEESAPGAAIGIAIKISSYADRTYTPVATHPPT